MDWRASYQEHMAHARETLRAARRAGRHAQLSKEIDAERLSDQQIEHEALKEAERVVNMAIIMHNDELEALARKARN